MFRILRSKRLFPFTALDDCLYSGDTLFFFCEVGKIIKRYLHKVLASRLLLTSHCPSKLLRTSTALLNCYWHPTALLNCYWHLTSLLNRYWYPTALLNCYWHPTALLNCYWYSAALINCYWHSADLINCYWHPNALLNCYWHPTALINCYWHPTAHCWIHIQCQPAAQIALRTFILSAGRTVPYGMWRRDVGYVVSDVSSERAAFLLEVQKVRKECVIPKPLDLWRWCWEGRRPHSAIPDCLNPQAQPFRTSGLRTSP